MKNQSDNKADLFSDLELESNNLISEDEYKGSIQNFLEITEEKMNLLTKVTIVNPANKFGGSDKKELNKLKNKIFDLENLKLFRLEGFSYIYNTELFKRLFLALSENLETLELPCFFKGNADKIEQISELFSILPLNLKSLDLTNNSLFIYICKSFQGNIKAKPFENLPQNLNILNLSHNDLNIPKIKVIVGDEDLIGSQNPSPLFASEDLLIRRTLAQLSAKDLAIISDEGSDVINILPNVVDFDNEVKFKYY